MSKHTKGPWVLFDDEDSHTLAIHDSEDNPNNPVVHWGGFDDNGEQTFAEKRANAELIAAAPEMLEALELLVGPAETCGVRKCVTDLARKAIAKSRLSPDVRSDD